MNEEIIITELKFIDKVPFGKYKGKTLRQCVNFMSVLNYKEAQDFINYWNWFSDKVENFKLPNNFIDQLKIASSSITKEYWMNQNSYRKKRW